MKLFIWKDVLAGYTLGIYFALAENVDEARKLVLDKCQKAESLKSSISLIASNLNTPPLIVDSKEGFYVWGM